MATFPIFDKKKEPFPVDDLWLQEREPYFGHELEGVQRDPVSGKSKKRTDRCKQKHRTDLKLDEWAKFDYFSKTNVNDLLGIDVAYPVSPQIDRVHQSRLSVQQFIDNYERPAVPCIITGCADKWRARKEWSFESFSKSYGNTPLKCGEDDEGYKVKVKTKYFLKYMYHQRDDSPLYLFDSSFDEREETKSLCDHYSPPKYFREDLFRLVGEKRRPPYRWFLIGPRRSGTCVHIDPLATSAWNTLLRGRKRWILFPPETSKTLVKGKHHKLPGEDDEAIDYFLKMLPRIKAEGRAKNLKYIEFIQYPGDTIFLPGGWWHGVLNIDDTVAVTQNFCDSVNFPLVWRKTRKGRKKMAVKFLEQLKIHYPKLAEMAIQMNISDGFVMRQKNKKKRKNDGSTGGTANISDDSNGNGDTQLDDDEEKLKRGKHSREHNTDLKNNVSGNKSDSSSSSSFKLV